MISLTKHRQKTDTAYHKRTGVRAFTGYVSQNWILFALGAPAIILIFLISYVPMFGTVIAFENYSPRTGFFSPWVGLQNYSLLWNSPVLWRLLRNTVSLNAMFITAETISGVVLALLLNEVRSTGFKRISQSIMFLPYFMGWTIVAMVLFGLTDYDVGTINALLEKVGLARVLITNNASIWPAILIAIRVWKDSGSGCIIYLAVLVGIDPPAPRSRRHRWRWTLAAHALHIDASSAPDHHPAHAARHREDFLRRPGHDLRRGGE